MPTLSEKLSDLSVRVGDIEARAAAFGADQREKRDLKIAEMRANFMARQDNLQAAIQMKGDDVADAWNAFNQSMRERFSNVRAQIGAKKDAFDASRANRRAERLENNAILAIDFALVAIEDAELAVAEAIDARLDAAALAGSPSETARSELKSTF